MTTPRASRTFLDLLCPASIAFAALLACLPILVLGAPNSSNSQRLREVAERAGCPLAVLVQRAADIDWRRLGAIRSVGITAGASAPEVLVEEVIDAFGYRASKGVTSGLIAVAGWVAGPLPVIAYPLLALAAAAEATASYIADTFDTLQRMKKTVR